MHAVIFAMSGISELQRRNASPVHICCASAVNAKLDVDESDEKQLTATSKNPARPSVFLSDTFTSRLPGFAGSLARCYARQLAGSPASNCDMGHFMGFL